MMAQLLRGLLALWSVQASLGQWVQRSLVDDEGNELKYLKDVTVQDCERECEANSACHSFSFTPNRCHLKDKCVSDNDKSRWNHDYVTYYKPCSPEAISLRTIKEEGEVFAVAWSPDGATFTSGSWIGARTYSASTGKLVADTRWSRSGVTLSLAYSPDGKYLATGTHASAPTIFDTTQMVPCFWYDPYPYKCRDQSYKLVKDLGPDEWGNAVDFSPDGELVASTVLTAIGIWNTRTWQFVRWLHMDSHAESIKFSPDGKYLACSSGSIGLAGFIVIWDLTTGQSVQKLTGHQSIVYSVTYSPDGRYLASGSLDRTIKIWQAATGQLVRTMPSPQENGGTHSVDFSPDGKYLAAGSQASVYGVFDRTVLIFDIATGQVAQTLRGHTAYVNSVKYSPDGKYLASGSRDNTVRIWDVTTWQANVIRVGDHDANRTVLV